MEQRGPNRRIDQGINKMIQNRKSWFVWLVMFDFWETRRKAPPDEHFQSTTNSAPGIPNFFLTILMTFQLQLVFLELRHKTGFLEVTEPWENSHFLFRTSTNFHRERIFNETPTVSEFNNESSLNFHSNDIHNHFGTHSLDQTSSCNQKPKSKLEPEQQSQLKSPYCKLHSCICLCLCLGFRSRFRFRFRSKSCHIQHHICKWKSHKYNHNHHLDRLNYKLRDKLKSRSKKKYKYKHISHFHNNKQTLMETIWILRDWNWVWDCLSLLRINESMIKFSTVNLMIGRLWLSAFRKWISHAR
jgi:hypothetical protein